MPATRSGAGVRRGSRFTGSLSPTEPAGGPASGRCPLSRAHPCRPRHHAEKRAPRHQPKRIGRIGDLANAQFLTFVAHMASFSQHRIVVRLTQIRVYYNAKSQSKRKSRWSSYSCSLPSTIPFAKIALGTRAPEHPTPRAPGGA
jgi:hypothetical protein